MEIETVSMYGFSGYPESYDCDLNVCNTWDKQARASPHLDFGAKQATLDYKNGQKLTFPNFTYSPNGNWW